MNEAVWYAIPSRGRADSVAERTVATLLRLEVPAERISVFADPAEMPDYFQALEQTGVKLLAGASGMAEQRNAILDAYPPGTELVQIDDDIAEIVHRVDDKTLEPLTPRAWARVVEMAFKTCRRTGARLWGVYPVANPMFMRDRVRTDLTYICGNLYGCLVEGDADDPLRPTLEDKEDYERTLQCYAEDQSVIRVEYVSTKTRFYDAPGGMQTDGLRTEERIRASAEELVRRYPMYASLNLTKRSGHAELRLRDPSVRGPVAAPR